eukprot:CAMPEP_0176179766 /NCGR_PEP_ID=MMETSP0120_2-20121206/92106_1 /TAXON_ID=160619 /ORGANISM="Kryptoperidinium foliaceum, Strain CCMP 1326" /LENGTH=102 /DNA_ID=CAMNT_0017517945 /DNA_START=31 /DNA_END=336 /DNA_ORIENTATION=+
MKPLMSLPMVAMGTVRSSLTLNPASASKPGNFGGRCAWTKVLQQAAKTLRKRSLSKVFTTRLSQSVSQMTRRPPGRNTLRASSRARGTSGTYNKTWENTTAS